MNIKNSYCQYYQANVDKKLTWFFVATFRSFEHLAFDRTLDVENSIFEFFVPKDLEADFLKVMKNYEEIKMIWDLKKLENRLLENK